MSKINLNPYDLAEMEEAVKSHKLWISGTQEGLRIRYEHKMPLLEELIALALEALAARKATDR